MLTRQSDPPNPTLGWQPHFAGIMALLDMAQVSLRHIHTKYNEGRLTDSAMAQRDLSADPSRSHQTRGGGAVILDCRRPSSIAIRHMKRSGVGRKIRVMTAPPSSRSYIAGQSMGGNGAWELAAANTDRFAAVAPPPSPFEARNPCSGPGWSAGHRIWPAISDFPVEIRQGAKLRGWGGARRSPRAAGTSRARTRTTRPPRWWRRWRACRSGPSTAPTTASSTSRTRTRWIRSVAQRAGWRPRWLLTPSLVANSIAIGCAPEFQRGLALERCDSEALDSKQSAPARRSRRPAARAASTHATTPPRPASWTLAKSCLARG